WFGPFRTLRHQLPRAAARSGPTATACRRPLRGAASRGVLQVRQHVFEPGLVLRRDHRRPAEGPLALGGLARQDVPLERAAAHELSGGGPLEPLRGALVRLQLRHDLTSSVRAPSSCAAYALFTSGEGSGVLSAGESAWAFSAAAFLMPGRAVRIVCIWLPSRRGSVSARAISFSSPINRSRMRRPISGCAISRPRKKMTAFTLSPSVRKRSMLRFLN